MKRLMIAVIVVVTSISGQALAGSWAGVLGNYPSYGGIYGGHYGYGVGGIISQIGQIQVANRVIDLAAQQQRQQSYVVREYVSVPVPAPVNNQYFEDVRIRGRIRDLEDANQRLRNENAELNKKLDDMQKKLDRTEKMLQELLAKEAKTK